jgi:hypothetical protein
MIAVRNEEMPDGEEKKMADFWDGKDPCWVVNECPEYLRKKCPAFRQRDRPCWEVAYTQSEVLTYIKKDCKYCRVYNLYHAAALNNEK